MTEYIERHAILQSLNESLEAANKWRKEAKTEEIKIRAEQAYLTFIEARLRIKGMPAADVNEVPIKHKCIICPHCDKCDVNDDGTLSSAQPEQRWIPVSERLPEEGHDVLITKEPFKIKGCEHEVIKAKRSVDPRSGKIEWWSPEFGALTNKAVLAWMPLPEPYEEVKNG